MLSEIVNAIFLTFLASEYLVADDLPSRRQNAKKKSRVWIFLLLLLGVLLINLLDRVSGAYHMVHDMLESFLHIPRVLLVAFAYLGALYLDAVVMQQRRKGGDRLPFRSFASMAGWAMCKVLPIYPFLAVIMSFVFLFVINIWEALHLPMEWLNMPIYYGTLYGPFAWVYVQVKQQILQQASSLPTITATTSVGRRSGSAWEASTS